MKRFKKFNLFIIFVFLVGILIFAVWQLELPTRVELDRFILKYGNFGPLAIIGILILQTILAPIPGTIVPIAVGALYGVWLGTFYTWIGSVLGTSIAFGIARILGRPIIQKIISSKKIEYYDNFLKRNNFLIWVVYIIPVVFPLDIISFVIGLSAIKFRQFIIVVTLGFIPHLLILTYFGERLLSASKLERLIYLLGVILILVFILKKINLENNKLQKEKE